MIPEEEKIEDVASESYNGSIRNVCDITVFSCDGLATTTKEQDGKNVLGKAINSSIKKLGDEIGLDKRPVIK